MIVVVTHQSYCRTIITHIPTNLNSADYQTKNLSVKEHNRQVKNYVKFPPPDPENPSLKPSVRKKVTFSERVY